MSIFRFARLIPGTTQFHETGHCADRASAEHHGHREMIANRHLGGVIVEYFGGPESMSRVVAVANVHDFQDSADDHLDVLAWWHGLSEGTRRHFADGSLDLDGPIRSDVGPSAIIECSINHGPYLPELSPPFADFVGAIVGEDAPWLEGAPLHLFGS